MPWKESGDRVALTETSKHLYFRQKLLKAVILLKLTTLSHIPLAHSERTYEEVFLNVTGHAGALVTICK